MPSGKVLIAGEASCMSQTTAKFFESIAEEPHPTQRQAHAYSFPPKGTLQLPSIEEIQHEKLRSRSTSTTRWMPRLRLSYWRHLQRHKYAASNEPHRGHWARPQRGQRGAGVRDGNHGRGRLGRCEPRRREEGWLDHRSPQRRVQTNRGGLRHLLSSLHRRARQVAPRDRSGKESTT